MQGPRIITEYLISCDPWIWSPFISYLGLRQKYIISPIVQTEVWFSFAANFPLRDLQILINYIKRNFMKEIFFSQGSTVAVLLVYSLNRLFDLCSHLLHVILCFYSCCSCQLLLYTIQQKLQSDNNNVKSLLENKYCT